MMILIIMRMPNDNHVDGDEHGYDSRYNNDNDYVHPDVTYNDNSY